MTDQMINCNCEDFKPKRKLKRLEAGKCICVISDPSKKTARSLGKIKNLKIIKVIKTQHN